jgi:hypothetical protein
MDFLRIEDKSYLYSVDNVKDNLFKFKENTKYLMSHHFVLWNKSFFMKNIGPKHNPWQSEREQSKFMAKTAHSIFIINDKWYNATVKRGVLQPIGEEMLTAAGIKE